MYRRYKRLAISFQTEPDKFQLIAILRKLPDDAKLIRTGESMAEGCNYLIFESQEWDIVVAGNEIPYFEPWVTSAEAVSARVTTDGDYPAEPIQLETMDDILAGFCICDFKYTGRRVHLPNCPLR